MLVALLDDESSFFENGAGLSDGEMVGSINVGDSSGKDGVVAVTDETCFVSRIVKSSIDIDKNFTGGLSVWHSSERRHHGLVRAPQVDKRLARVGNRGRDGFPHGRLCCGKFIGTKRG